MAAGRASKQAERRRVTVLFCDLVGSTELSTRLDPEDMHELVLAFQHMCASVVGRFDGHVAKYLGDAVLVFFGYPRAHEDDAHRAVRTGLGMVSAIEQLNPRLEREYGARLAARVGIHTGLVVAGEMGTDEARNLDIVGETPSIAARLQSLAEPDTVVITETTSRLTAGYFDCEDLGPRTIKGLDRPLRVIRVLHESAARSRLDAAGPGGLTPLVGRELERDALFDAWRRARDGNGGVILLSGEPGIGKSRLVRELMEHVAEDPAAWLTPCQCSPYRENSSLYPVIDVLERVALQLAESDDAETKLRKLEGWAVQYGLRADEAVPLLAPLLSVPLGDRFEPLRITPERHKQLAMETLVRTLHTIAGEQPLLFVIEDVHWADPSTLEFLELLIERASSRPMLVLLTSRPGSRPQLSNPAIKELKLRRMEPQLVTQLARSVAGGKELPGEVRKQIVMKADGVPLFVEELTKTVLESGLLAEADTQFELVGTLPAVAVPVTLEGSLLARLDRLATARELAQVAAVLGRDFTKLPLREVMLELGMTDDELDGALQQLLDAEIIFEQLGPTGVVYVFKHALIRDAAYESLLKSRRRFYHGEIARVLVARFPEIVDSEPELIAHHYTEAGQPAEAIPFWKRAAERSIERSGNIEAIAYINIALELLDRLPDSPDRDGQELELLVTLGVPLIATRGYAAPEVERTYGRARALSLEVGETPQLPNILWGMWVYYLTGGPLPAALEMADEYGAVAASHPDDSGLAVETCQLKGIPLFYSGEFAQALPHLERGTRLYDQTRHHAHVFAHGGADTGVALMTHAGLALWALGRAESARERMHGALVLARSLSHPFSLAFGYYYLAWFHKLCRDEESALAAANAASGICEEFGFPFWGLSSAVLRGTTRVRHGQLDEGIAEARSSLAAFEATGALLCRSALRGLLAAAYLEAGRAEEGLAVVTEALDGLPEREERWWEPELHRLRGELLRLGAEGGDAEAEASFERALELARRRQAASWEERAVVSLAGLWRDRGETTRARELLAELPR